MADDNRIQWSQEQWGSVCESVDPSEEEKTEYEFSNGRKFERK